MTKEPHIPRALRPGRDRLTQALALYLTKHPDMRVGQAIENATSEIGQGRGENLDSFYIEDDVLADGFDRLNARK